jgi:hypothetical protein
MTIRIVYSIELPKTKKARKVIPRRILAPVDNWIGLGFSDRCLWAACTPRFARCPTRLAMIADGKKKEISVKVSGKDTKPVAEKKRTATGKDIEEGEEERWSEVKLKATAGLCTVVGFCGVVPKRSGASVFYFGYDEFCLPMIATSRWMPTIYHDGKFHITLR